jgi:biopolymer transport protein TolR
MRSSGPRPEMNVAPLVDVVLVLLIIFMVVTPQMEAGAAIELPTAANLDSRKPKKEPFVIGVGKDGRVFFEKNTAASTDLVGDLEALKRSDPARSLRIKGDYRASYKAVREVFRTAQAVGFPGIGIQVIDKNKPGTAAPAGGG